MILLIPNAEALKLALLAGAVPANLAAAPAEAAFGKEGEIWLRPSKPVARQALAALARFGIESIKPARLEMHERLLCWHHAIALERFPKQETTAQTPILFDLKSPEAFTQLAGEILRLGNDRQSYRVLQDQTETRTLLRVIGPPYYSLLQALEGEIGAPTAYVEQSPRIWTQLGWRHPLAAQLRPPPGRALLLRPPGAWEIVPEAPFHDLYEAIEFQLPDAPVSLHEGELGGRLTVPLRLTAGSSNDPPELWVLREEAADEIERLVNGADDQLLARLAFAASHDEGQATIVVRVRPSKLPPPELVLRAEAFRPYLKLPNLFVPVGRRLRPPLRRDAAAKLLVSDPRRIVWLYPNANGLFTPQSVADSAVRPLTDWIDYVLDREHEALGAWMAAHQFDFEPFICPDEQSAKKPPPEPRKAAKSETQKSPSSPMREPTEEELRAAARFEALMKERESAIESIPDSPTTQGERRREALMQRLEELQKEFSANDAPLDAPERRPVWRQMGSLHTALEQRHDATLCWSNALWEEDPPSPATLGGWLFSEQQGVGSPPLDKATLERLLAEAPASPLPATFAAAWLAWAAHQSSPPVEIVSRLPALARILERNESELPVRTAWLGWHALHRLSHGDALLLARARDRLLERLFQNGLTAELDLPGFVVQGKVGQTSRLPVVRARFKHIRQRALEWIAASGPWVVGATAAYADLIFAYALARLGQIAEAKVIAEAAAKTLGDDPVHAWLRDAFLSRLALALRGGSGEALDRQLVERLSGMETLDRYKAERLREHSRILEPHERVDPYRHLRQGNSDALTRRILELHDLHSRSELARHVTELLQATESEKERPERRVAVLAASLDVAPRLGDKLATKLLADVQAALPRLAEALDRIMLLGKATFVAGHFDKTEQIHDYVQRFKLSVDEIINVYFSLEIEHNPLNREKARAIEEFFSQSLRTLRKLGLRAEIDVLLDRTSQLVANAVGDKPPPERLARGLRLRLSVASGWLYFGRAEKAVQILDEARRTLLSAELRPIDRKSLACAYLSALGVSPIDTALPRIEELFVVQKGKRRLEGVEINFTTNSHYSLSQLDIVEAATLALASEEFALNPEAKRRLDEDEFLVRRRIHRDAAHGAG